MSTTPRLHNGPATPQSECDVATAQTDHGEEAMAAPTGTPIIHDTPQRSPTPTDGHHEPADDASEVLSEVVDATAAGARPRHGYCWLSLLPNELRRAARRRYPPYLDQCLVGILRDKLGPDTQLAYTVAHYDVFHYFHVRPGVGTTLAELYLLMDCDSFVGVDVSMGGDDLEKFLVEDLQGSASPSGSDDSVSTSWAFQNNP
ncbi:hypothetical protein BDZ89DRAFT_1067293 [Hymenopellis radicata]|nr:hypothetical protein BDZ89DRAFT_1067293 [Hymenopellis radicata]